MKQKENPAMAGQDHEAGRGKRSMSCWEYLSNGADSQALDPVAWTVRA